MPDYRYTLTLTLQAPVLTQSVGALSFGYDMAMLKDGDTPVLPGSLIRGNLREALERFVTVLEKHSHTTKSGDLNKSITQGDINKWFGPQPPKPEKDEETFPQTRAAFNFDYYWRCQPFAIPAIPRNRITLDPTTGTVKRRALIVIDAAGGPDRNLVFCGSIMARLADAQAAETARVWLEKAAQFLSALGSLKGVGYGKLLAVSLECESIPLPVPAPVAGNPERIGLRLTLDRPFCLAQPRAPESNQFKGEESISGAALKGVLARWLDDAAKTALHFDELVFTHALPSRDDSLDRRRVLPLSLAWAGDDPKQGIPGKWADMALLSNDNADFVRISTGKAATFQIDWKGKEWKAAQKLSDSLPTCGRHLAVHTAIERDTGQSKEKQLFSLDCVEPKGMAWCADIDIGAVTAIDRPQVLDKLLAVLAHPLVGLGKTKAVVNIAIQPRAFLPESALKPIEGENCFVVSLQTPAVLFYDGQAKTIPASGGGYAEEMDKKTADKAIGALHDCYHAFWDTVSGHSLRLKRFFAAQQREGGPFVWNHYLQHRQSPDTTYRPFWLTAAGSVFVLEIVEGKLVEATKKLEIWRKLGLPSPDNRPSHDQWPYNPYIRENGYGEIRVNDDIHLRYRANAKEVEWS